MFENSKRKLKKLFPDVNTEKESMIGSKLNFASAEAYKLLRTNIMFSFTEEQQKRVIGVTSSIKGEGKSITSINLAYSLAESNKKVLFMECDLRMPTISKRPDIRPTPGLSNLLAGLNNGNEAIQNGILNPNLDIMPAGDVPPNASELLGSMRMQHIVEKLIEFYDYIILDLPPVNVVSDALIASRLTNGMVVVVRQDFVGKSALAETMRQLKYADAKILGFVFNGVHNSDKYYKKYYKKSYNYGYNSQM